MTMLNVWCSPKRAIVAVDVLGGHPDDDSPMLVNKVAYMPHSNVVIAGRGFAGILFSIACGFQNSEGDYDDLEGAFVELCTASLGAFRDAAVRAGHVDRTGESDVQLVGAGWSDRAGEMRACQCIKSKGSNDGFTTRRIDPYILSPGEPWAQQPNPGVPDSLDKMFALGQTQNHWWHRTLPNLPFGGRMVFAEMTRHSTHFTSRKLP